jgi:hypothetical protein
MSSNPRGLLPHFPQAERPHIRTQFVVYVVLSLFIIHFSGFWLLS